MAERDYKSTLSLPKTAFPMKANLPKREPETLTRWDEMDLYTRLIETRKDHPAWVLHDGPPYANGRVHLGTAPARSLSFVVRARCPFIAHPRSRMGLPRNADRVQVSRLGDERTMSKPNWWRCRSRSGKWLDLQRTVFATRTPATGSIHT